MELLGIPPISSQRTLRPLSGVCRAEPSRECWILTTRVRDQSPLSVVWCTHLSGITNRSSTGAIRRCWSQSTRRWRMLSRSTPMLMSWSASHHCVQRMRAHWKPWSSHRWGNRIFNTLRPRQNGRHLAHNIFKYIFLNANLWILNKISLKYVLWGLIDNMAALIQIMASRRRGGKPLSEAMLVCFTDAYMCHSASTS